MNFEHPTTIFAVIRDVMFLAQGKERENVGNAIRIEVNLIRAKICNGCGRHGTFVAVDVDGSRSRTDVVDQIRVGE